LPDFATHLGTAYLGRSVLLHTDASEICSGVAPTQIQQGIEDALSFASQRWFVTDAKRSEIYSVAALTQVQQSIERALSLLVTGGS